VRVHENVCPHIFSYFPNEPDESVQATLTTAIHLTRSIDTNKILEILVG